MHTIYALILKYKKYGLWHNLKEVTFYIHILIFFLKKFIKIMFFNVILGQGFIKQVRLVK